MTRISTKTNDAISVCFSTQLGWMGLAWQGTELVRLTFGNRTAAIAAQELPSTPVLAEALTKKQRELVGRMTRFAEGAHDDFLDVELSFDKMTAFQNRVYRACRMIGWGKTASYAELAKTAGSPRAARAVGNVMASNRFPLIIPCHRIIGSGHKQLGGFSAPGGVSTKSKLLAREQD